MLELDEELAGITRLEYHARRLVRGLRAGAHRSPFRGRGSEFREHSAYRPGDDLRDLDWRVLARSDRLVVRRFDARRHVRLTVILDASASMGWTGSRDPKLRRRLDPDRAIPRGPDGEPLAPRSKLDAARVLTLALSMVLLGDGDEVALLPLGEGGEGGLAPAGGPPQRHRIRGLLERLPGAGSADLEQSLEGLVARGRGPIALISDLLDDVPRLAELAAQLVSRGRELRVVQLLDPAEMGLWLSGDLQLRDLETGESLPVRPDDLRAAYREELERHLQSVQAAVEGAGGRYLRLLTDEPLLPPLAHLLGLD